MPKRVTISLEKQEEEAEGCAKEIEVVQEQANPFKSERKIERRVGQLPQKASRESNKDS